MMRQLALLLLLLLPTNCWAGRIPILEPYVASTFQHNASATSVAATIPSSWNYSDEIIVICATSSINVTWVAPTGFTSFYTNQGPSTPNYWVGWRYAVTADLTGSATVTCSTSAGSAGSLSAVILGANYVKYNAVAGYDSIGTSTSGTSTTPSIAA